MRSQKQTRNNLKGVLFDLDGTLIDSMPFHFKAWKKSIKYLYNIDIQTHDFLPLEGMQLRKIAPTILKKYNFDVNNINYQKLILLKESFFLSNYKLRFYPYVKLCIKQLKNRNLKLAIVTSGLRERLFKSVPKKFLDNFDVIITGEDTTYGKPSKQPFYKAVNTLRLKSKECIVIENAPLGIQSAKNANIYCIAIATTLNKKLLIKADLVVDTFKDVYIKLMKITKNDQ